MFPELLCPTPVVTPEKRRGGARTQQLQNTIGAPWKQKCSIFILFLQTHPWQWERTSLEDTQTVSTLTNLPTRLCVSVASSSVGDPCCYSDGERPRLRWARPLSVLGYLRTSLTCPQITCFTPRCKHLSEGWIVQLSYRPLQEKLSAQSAPQLLSLHKSPQTLLSQNCRRSHHRLASPPPAPINEKGNNLVHVAVVKLRFTFEIVGKWPGEWLTHFLGCQTWGGGERWGRGVDLRQMRPTIQEYMSCDTSSSGKTLGFCPRTRSSHLQWLLEPPCANLRHNPYAAWFWSHTGPITLHAHWRYVHPHRTFC